MFDFVNYTYSGILSIIAALIGLGLPLIIGRIEGIDERYKSTLLTKRFKQESSFTWYIVLTIANVIIAIVIPFIMDYSANARIWIAVQSGMLVLLLVNLYILLSDMLVYTNPIELQERILKDLHKHKNAPKKAEQYFNQWIDLTPFILNSADDNVAQSVYNEWYSYLSEFYQKTEEVREFDDYFLKGLTRINENLCTGKRRLMSINNGNSIVKSLLPPDKRAIPEKHYMHLWRNLILQSFYDRDDWILEYWDSASQHYEYMMREADEKTQWRFLEFHLMLAATLLWQKKYSLVQDMTSLSHSIPETYPLVPSTVAEILRAFYRINRKADEPNNFAYYESHYPIPSMHGINEGVVLGTVNKYLALLIYRVYSLHWQYGQSAALNNGISVNQDTTLYELSKWRDSLQIIEHWLKRLENDKALLDLVYYEELEGREVPSPEQIIAEAQAFVERCIEQRRVSGANSEAIIAANKGSVATAIQNAIVPYKVFERSEQHDGKTYKVNCSVNAPIENTAFQEEPDVCFVEPEEGLVRIAMEHLSMGINQVFYNAPRMQTYTIAFESLIEALDTLKISDKYVIVSSGLNWQYFSVYSDKIRFNESGHTGDYDGIPIYDIPCYHPVLNNMIYVVEKNKLPHLSYVKPDDNQINDYHLERADEQYEIWMSIKKFVDNPEMRKFGQKLGDDINTYSLFTIGWMPRITIQEQQMLAVAIKVSYEFVNEGKTDDIDKVKSMRAIKMKYKKQQDGNNE